jgi:signal transduction histidine kinase
METDLQRLNQILKNLFSNSFKFTEKGEVKLNIYEAKKSDWKAGNQRKPRHCQKSGGLRYYRYRYWYPAGETEYHFRSVPAGRRFYQP